MRIFVEIREIITTKFVEIREIIAKKMRLRGEAHLYECYANVDD